MLDERRIIYKRRIDKVMARKEAIAAILIKWQEESENNRDKRQWTEKLISKIDNESNV